MQGGVEGVGVEGVVEAGVEGVRVRAEAVCGRCVWKVAWQVWEVCVAGGVDGGVEGGGEHGVEGGVEVGVDGVCGRWCGRCVWKMCVR